MSTYILIHGAWHGSWCWDKMIPHLQQSGHTVYTPDLPGRGNVSLIGIDLNSHVNAIGQLMKSCSEPVILVGHSMAGMIVTQLVQDYSQYIRKLIYLAAFFPQTGESLLDITKTITTPGVCEDVVINTEQNSIALKLSPRLHEIFYNCCQPQDSDILKQLCAEPFAGFTTRVTVTNAKLANIDKLYIACSEDIAIPLATQLWMAKRSCCPVMTLDTDHSPFLSMPQQLSALLLEAAENNKENYAEKSTANTDC